METMPTRKDSRKFIGIAAAALLVVAPSVAAGTAQGGAREAARATEQGVKLIEGNRFAEALQQLDRAIAADPEYWEAHYQRGRVLGILDRWQESRDALVLAAELNAGHGHTHRLASMAAAQVSDWQTAWDQAIKAQLAGEDMRQNMLDMYNESPPPDDFAIRINAAPVFVATAEDSDARAQAELPTNFNPGTTGTDPGGVRSGRATHLEDSALNSSGPDLVRLERQMRSALAESNRFAVVVQPGRAKFILAISITDIESGVGAERTSGRSASGYFRLIDIESREVVYRANISFEDISATTAIQGVLRRYVTDLAAWMAEREPRR
ncbi:MAG TPA: hypothetical protein VGD06_10050 [Acidobacteriota bacterium]